MRSAFEKYNPWTYLVYLIGSIILAMTLWHPLFLTIGIILTISLHLVVDRGKMLSSFLGFYIGISLVTALLNPLLSHRGATILFYLNDQCITLEAFLYGIIMGLSLFLILCIFSLYQCVISSDKLMYLFCRRLPRLTLVLMLSLRMVPLLKNRIEMIREVQLSQGICLEKGKLRARSQTAMENLNTLVGWSLEEVMQSARSIRSRGYGVKKKRSFYFKYHIEKRDIIIMSVEIILVMSIIALWKQGGYTFFPRTNLEIDGVYTKLILVGYVAYMSIPLLIEGWECCKWR